ncbi:MAG TPA: ATP-binding protein [Spirochaetaceae bacterium]|jgi:DNA helicase HerA-like ATPase|nr:ATP-binding protein [Spirochaetaceae bacterium]
MATRHGLVTGATGTGKTVTLQALAQGFSDAGVPVLCCDIKGDLSGIAAAGSDEAKIAGAFAKLGLTKPAWNACPATFWDVAGALGHPLRATACDLGPLLMSRLLGLKDVQADTLRLLFRIADEKALPVLDLADLRALVGWASDNAAALKSAYGLLSSATLGAIQRSVLVLEDTGAGRFFGEPALDMPDLMRTAPDGRGVVNIIAAEGLMAEPALYAAVLLHLLGELFEELPEAGDLSKPKLILLLDEAHLLFDDAPKALIDAVERTARLVRSKGVGLWLVTQSPLDLPASVLGQLGNRVHHALRAYTPNDRKALDSIANSLRPNPALNAAAAITELGVGEALVSFLDAEGRPMPVERARVVPPASRVGALSTAERAALIAASPLGARYDKPIDRESAHEILKRSIGADPAASEPGTPPLPRQAQGAAAREPTIEEIEAELRGFPLERSTGQDYADERPYGDEPSARGTSGRGDGGRGSGARAPSPRAAAPRNTASRGAYADTAGSFAAELARAALNAAGRELGRQAVRGLLGTRRRKR